MPGFRLGIYVFKDAEIVDFAAPHGVWSVARRYDPELDAFLIADAMRPVQAQAGFTVLPNYCFDDRPAMDAFLIPGGFGTRQEMYNRRLHEFIASLPGAMPADQRVHRVVGLRANGPARRPAGDQPQGARPGRVRSGRQGADRPPGRDRARPAGSAARAWSTPDGS